MSSRSASATWLIAVLAVLAGCRAGADFRRPAPPRAHAYVPSDEADNDARGQQYVLGEGPGRDWWRSFGSDALDEIVQRALRSNRTLAAANASLTQAQELAIAQAGGLAPQIGATAGIGKQKYGAQFLGSLPKPPPFTYFAFGPTVSYVLDYTGGIASSIEQQYALAEYQRQQRDAAYLSVTGNAVLNSIRIALLLDELATAQAILEEDRENLDLVRTAFEAGSVSRLDTVSAENQLASDLTSLPPLRQALSAARHSLAVLTGRFPSEEAIPHLKLADLTLPTQLPVTLPSELVHRRPDILASEAQLHAATAALGVAAANLYPHISLSASTGQQSTELAHLFDGASNVYSAAAALTAPLVDGGTLRAQKRAAAAATQASLASYEQVVLAAFAQVADALSALGHDAEELDAQSHALAAARDNLELTRRSYHEGNVGVLQVLDAERLDQNARLGYLRAQAQRYMDTAQLFLALGGGATGTDVRSAKMPD